MRIERLLRDHPWVELLSDEDRRQLAHDLELSDDRTATLAEWARAIASTQRSAPPRVPISTEATLDHTVRCVTTELANGALKYRFAVDVTP